MSDALSETDHLIRIGWAFVAVMDGDQLKIGFLEGEPVLAALAEQEDGEDKWGACIVTAGSPGADLGVAIPSSIHTLAKMCVEAFCSGDEECDDSIY